MYGPLAVYFLLTQVAVAADDTLEEIVVTASLRSTSVAELPQSVTVLDKRRTRGRGSTLKEVLGLIPDLNWAAGYFAAPLFPAARHWRGRAVPRRAESLRRVTHR